MNVATGAECSGRTRTWRPLASRVYSEIPPTVLTKVKPSGAVGGEAQKARAGRKASRARAPSFMVVGKGEGVLVTTGWAIVSLGQGWNTNERHNAERALSAGRTKGSGQSGGMNRALPLAALMMASASFVGLCQAAVTIPYTNDFSGTTGNGAFETETSDAQWSVSGGKYVNNFVSGGGGVSSSASLQVSNIANSTFTMSMDFTISAASDSFTVGFGLLGGNAAFNGTTGAYYLADVNYSTSGSHQLRLFEIGSSNTNLASSANAAYQLSLNTTYSLRLAVTKTTSSVSMTLGLYDAGGNQLGSSVTATDSTPLSGTYFGLRNRANTTSGTHTVSFDNFSIAAIPEPSSFAMAAGGLIGALVVIARRRPRRN